MPIQDVPLISHYLCLCILGISRFWFEFWSEIFGTKFKFPIFQYFFFFFFSSGPTTCSIQQITVWKSLMRAHMVTEMLEVKERLKEVKRYQISSQ